MQQLKITGFEPCGANTTKTAQDTGLCFRTATIEYFEVVNSNLPRAVRKRSRRVVLLIPDQHVFSSKCSNQRHTPISVLMYHSDVIGGAKGRGSIGIGAAKNTSSRVPRTVLFESHYRPLSYRKGKVC